MIPLNEKLHALQRSPIRQFTNLANQTPGCIKLTIGEPDFDTPQAIKETAIAALKDGQTHYAPIRDFPPCGRPLPNTKPPGAWSAQPSRS